MEKVRFRLEIQGGGHVQDIFVAEDSTPIDAYSITAGVDETAPKSLYAGNLGAINRIVVQTPKNLVRQSDSVPVKHTITIQSTSQGTIFSQDIYGLLMLDFNDADGADISSIQVSTNADFRTDVTMIAWGF